LGRATDSMKTLWTEGERENRKELPINSGGPEKEGSFLKRVPTFGKPRRKREQGGE